MLATCCCPPAGSSFPHFSAGDIEAREVLIQRFPVGSDARAAAEWLEYQHFACFVPSVERNPIIARAVNPGYIHFAFGLSQRLSDEPRKIATVLCREKWPWSSLMSRWYVQILLNDDETIHDIGTLWKGYFEGP